MRSNDVNKTKIHFLVILVIVYLVSNTGLISDDYILINIMNKKETILHLEGWFSTTPVLYYTQVILYKFFLDNEVLYIFVKFLIISVSYLMIYKFFTLFFDETRAIIGSFLLIFFPTHDSTVYWFLGSCATLMLACYLFAFYLLEKNKVILSFFFALYASFLYYGTTPIAIGLFVLFLFMKEYKKSFIILLPNVLYTIFYIYMTKFLNTGTSRLPEQVDIFSLLKSFALQLGTAIDSMVGISFILKVLYSITSISILSISILLILLVVLKKYNFKINESTKNHSKLIIAMITVMIFAFLMYSVTGKYPQLAFNLGNRTTLYASLLVVCLILIMKLRFQYVIFALLTLAIFGLSDHWKSWSNQQNIIINNMKMQNFDTTKELYIVGNQYSRLKEIDHIEFFSEGIVPKSILEFNNLTFSNVVSLNSSFKYEDGYLINRKYNYKIKLKQKLQIYDSEVNKVIIIDKEDLDLYLKNMTPIVRHWIQLYKDTFIVEWIVYLMPRLKYAF